MKVELWYAVDKDGCGWYFRTKPHRVGTEWYENTEGQAVMYESGNKLFPGISWEDEPIEVELTIKKQ